MLAKAGTIALLMGAGLVAMVSFTEAQSNRIIPQIEDQDLKKKLTDFKSKSDEVVKKSTAYLQFTSRVDNLLKWSPGTAAGRKEAESGLRQAIQQRDDAEKQLAPAVEATMKSATNEKAGKELEKVYDAIQAINKATSDALLRHDEALALLDERAAADSRAAGGATDH